MSLLPMRRWAWLLAIVPAFGCATKDLRAVITEYKPKVEPQLAKLEKIRDAARNAPRITVDHVDINGPPPKIGITDVDEHVNVAIEYLEDLDDLSMFGNVSFRMLGTASMNRCAAIFKTHRYPYNPHDAVVPNEIPMYVAEDNLKHCAGVRYVFVIRSVAFAPPSSVRKQNGPCPLPSLGAEMPAAAEPSTEPPAADLPDAGATAPEKCSLFTGGYLSAEVLVYDLTNATQIGGFRYTAESSPKIDVAGYTDEAAAIEPDFAMSARVAFQQAAQKYVPSFVVGY
ncbi:MAG TPA: hypothetical protein PKA58_24410 [Polyangium sp.]|nr:hypothetical protein [Polyangium sp.]